MTNLDDPMERGAFLMQNSEAFCRLIIDAMTEGIDAVAPALGAMSAEAVFFYVVVLFGGLGHEISVALDIPMEEAMASVLNDALEGAAEGITRGVAMEVRGERPND